MKKCDHCKQDKDDEAFAWRWKTLGIRQKTCRDCRKYFNKKWYEGDAKQRHLKNVKERKDARVRWQENLRGTTFLLIHVNNVARLILLSLNSITMEEKKELSA